MVTRMSRRVTGGDRSIEAGLKPKKGGIGGVEMDRMRMQGDGHLDKGRDDRYG
jgi:hypothetical protein